MSQDAPAAPTKSKLLDDYRKSKKFVRDIVAEMLRSKDNQLVRTMAASGHQRHVLEQRIQKLGISVLDAKEAASVAKAESHEFGETVNVLNKALLHHSYNQPISKDLQNELMHRAQIVINTNEGSHEEIEKLSTAVVSLQQELEASRMKESLLERDVAGFKHALELVLTKAENTLEQKGKQAVSVLVKEANEDLEKIKELEGDPHLLRLAQERQRQLAEMSAVKKEIEKLQNDKKTMENALRKAEQEVVQMRLKMMERDSSMAVVSKKIKAVESKLSEEQASSGNRIEAAERLAGELTQKYEAELKKNRDSLEEATKKMSEQGKQVDYYKSQVKDAKFEFVRVKKSLEKERIDVQTELTKKLTEERDKVTHLEHRIETDVKESVERAAVAESNLFLKQSEAQEANAKVATLEEQMTSLRETLEDTEQELQSAKSMATSGDREAGAAVVNLRKAYEKIEELNAEKEQLQREFDERNAALEGDLEGAQQRIENIQLKHAESTHQLSKSAAPEKGVSTKKKKPTKSPLVTDLKSPGSGKLSAESVSLEKDASPSPVSTTTKPLLPPVLQLDDGSPSVPVIAVATPPDIPSPPPEHVAPVVHVVEVPAPDPPTPTLSPTSESLLNAAAFSDELLGNLDEGNMQAIERATAEVGAQISKLTMWRSSDHRATHIKIAKKVDTSVNCLSATLIAVVELAAKHRSAPPIADLPAQSVQAIEPPPEARQSEDSDISKITAPLHADAKKEEPAPTEKPKAVVIASTEDTTPQEARDLPTGITEPVATAAPKMEADDSIEKPTLITKEKAPTPELETAAVVTHKPSSIPDVEEQSLSPVPAIPRVGSNASVAVRPTEEAKLDVEEKVLPPQGGVEECDPAPTPAEDTSLTKADGSERGIDAEKSTAPLRPSEHHVSNFDDLVDDSVSSASTPVPASLMSRRESTGSAPPKTMSFVEMQLETSSHGLAHKKESAVEKLARRAKTKEQERKKNVRAKTEKQHADPPIASSVSRRTSNVSIENSSVENEKIVQSMSASYSSEVAELQTTSQVEVSTPVKMVQSLRMNVSKVSMTTSAVQTSREPTPITKSRPSVECGTETEKNRTFDRSIQADVVPRSTKNHFVGAHSRQLNVPSSKLSPSGMHADAQQKSPTGSTTHPTAVAQPEASPTSSRREPSLNKTKSSVSLISENSTSTVSAFSRTVGENSKEEEEVSGRDQPMKAKREGMLKKVMSTLGVSSIPALDAVTKETSSVKSSKRESNVTESELQLTVLVSAIEKTERNSIVASAEQYMWEILSSFRQSLLEIESKKADDDFSRAASCADLQTDSVRVFIESRRKAETDRLRQHHRELVTLRTALSMLKSSSEKAGGAPSQKFLNDLNSMQQRVDALVENANIEKVDEKVMETVPTSKYNDVVAEFQKLSHDYESSKVIEKMHTAMHESTKAKLDETLVELNMLRARSDGEGNLQETKRAATPNFQRATLLPSLPTSDVKSETPPPSMPPVAKGRIQPSEEQGNIETTQRLTEHVSSLYQTVGAFVLTANKMLTSDTEEDVAPTSDHTVAAVSERLREVLLKLRRSQKETKRRQKSFRRSPRPDRSPHTNAVDGKRKPDATVSLSSRLDVKTTRSSSAATSSGRKGFDSLSSSGSLASDSEESLTIMVDAEVDARTEVVAERAAAEEQNELLKVQLADVLNSLNESNMKLSGLEIAASSKNIKPAVDLLPSEDWSQLDLEDRLAPLLSDVKKKLSSLELDALLDDALREGLALSLDEQLSAVPAGETPAAVMAHTRKIALKSVVGHISKDVARATEEGDIVREMITSFPRAHVEELSNTFDPDAALGLVLRLNDWWAQWVNKNNSLQRNLARGKEDSLHHILQICDMLDNVTGMINVEYAALLRADQSRQRSRGNKQASLVDLATYLQHRGRVRQTEALRRTAPKKFPRNKLDDQSASKGVFELRSRCTVREAPTVDPAVSQRNSRTQPSVNRKLFANGEREGLPVEELRMTRSRGLPVPTVAVLASTPQHRKKKVMYETQSPSNWKSSTMPLPNIRGASRSGVNVDKKHVK